MKQKDFFKTLLLLTLLLFFKSSYTQVTLSAGDIVLLQFNSDGGDDELVFLPLVDIPANSIIYFSDGGWNSASSDFGSTTERGIKYTVNASGLTAGTLIKLLNPTGGLYELSPGTLGTLDFFEVNGAAETGTSRELTLSTSGDQILIFQTSDGAIASARTFIYGFNSRSATGYTDGWQTNGNVLSSSSTDSHVPAGLTALNSTQSNKTTATAFGIAGLNGAHRDNWQYTGLFTATDRVGWLNRIHTLANWTNNDTTVFSHTAIASGSASVTVNASTLTWNGNTNNNWATSTNWDINLIPSSSDNVIIPTGLTNYPTISGTVKVNSLNIESGATLISANTFTTSNATYNRTLTNGSQWYNISSPVVNEGFDNTWVTNNSIASGQNDNRGVSWYDNTSSDTDSDGAGPDTATENWRYLQAGNSGTFNTAQGYSIIRTSSGNVSFSGTGIYTSTQTIGITQGASNSYNLVGNPFTAYLNLGDFFTDNPVTTVLTASEAYFWNGTSYDTRTSALHSSYEIAPGQGFFVEAAADTNLTFDISDVSHQGTDTFQKSSRPEIHLLVSDGSSSRYANVYYIDGTTTGFDTGYDGKLFGGTSQSFALYTHLVSDSQGINYQLQSLPNSDHENMVIPVGLKANKGKEIIFSTETLNLPSGIKVFLEDRQTNTFTRLDEVNSNYKVTLTEKSEGIGRFYLHSKSNVLKTNDINLKSISIYKTDNTTLKIVGLSQGKANVKLFNILGKQMMHTSFTSKGVSELTLPKLATGVYIVQLETEAGKLNKKIILE